MAKILVVDDEQDIRSFLRSLLEKEGFSVEEAENGDDAWTKIEAENFDIVLTDILMPKVNGIELTRKIIQEYPDIRVIVCSGGGDGGEITSQILLDTALDFGAVFSLGKPFQSNELIDTVKIALNYKPKD